MKKFTTDEKTVVVGMSGGVDSSVVAFLLKKQGFKVVGLHMKNSEDEQANEDELIVRKLAQNLDIELVVENFSDEMQKVKDYFAEEYQNGKTPNPCVLCNKEVKFKPFIEFANKIGADYFATGHYAKIEHDGNRHVLKKAVDESKDQTYFLNQLSTAQLEKALFPLGELSKVEVRKIAEENNLASAHKKDSFDVCFVGSEKFKDFMNKNYPSKPGNIVDATSGKVVGKHLGLVSYTIGQRKGLGIGGGFGTSGECWFVTGKDAKTNTLFVAQGNDDLLYSDSLVSKRFNWLVPQTKKQFECTAKFRYRQTEQKVVVQILDDASVSVVFDNKQRAITPGQFVVLYDGDICLGGGRIDEVIKNGEILKL